MVVNKNIPFDAVRECLSNIPNINFGGCGIAALVMYRHLKNLNEYPKIIFLNRYSSWEAAVNNIKFDFDEHKHAESVSHVCLYYKNKFIDCCKEIDITDYQYFEFVDEEKLINSLNHGNWNNIFKRRAAMDIIEEKLGYELVGIKY